MQKVMETKQQWMATSRIKVRAPFNSLFPIDGKTVDAVAEHMKARGYDQSQPIILWKELLDENKNQAIIVDGHTRLAAAKKIGLSPVYVARMSFADENVAVQHAIHNQRDRRNLTDADLIRCIEAVDKRSSWGGDRKSADTKIKSSSEPLISSAKATAETVGTSETKVKKARILIDHADEGTKQVVLDGKKSIHAAAKETQQKRKQQKVVGKRLSKKEKEQQARFDEAYEAFFKVVQSVGRWGEWEYVPREHVISCLNSLRFLVTDIWTTVKK